MEGLQREPGVKKKFQKTLILVLEEQPKVCLDGCMNARLPQRLKSMSFENFSSLRISFADPPLDFFFQKNVDFSRRGKQYIVTPKWTFFLISAHCVVYL